MGNALLDGNLLVEVIFMSEWCSSGDDMKKTWMYAMLNFASEGRRVQHSAKMPSMGST